MAGTGSSNLPDAAGRQGFLHTVVRRPVAVTMVVLAAGVFGLVSLSRLPVSLLPDVSYPTLTVRTEYPGAAPIDVERLVTRKIEENLAVISNLVTYRSVSRAGVSDVILEFEWDTSMTFAVQDVREKVAQLQPRLPEGVGSPLILRYDPTLDPIMRVALHRPPGGRADGDAHLYELRRVAEEDLQRGLETIPGVAAVRARGGYEEEWRIELEERLLKLYGVSTRQVRERVAIENVNVAGGRILDGDREILVRTVGEITRPDQLRDLVVLVREGTPVRVRDLGRVVQGRKERDVITRAGGTESVEIEIFKEAGANLVDVAHAVKTRLFGNDWRDTLVAGRYTGPREEVPGGTGGALAGAGGTGQGGDGPLFASQARGLAAGLAEAGVLTSLLSDQSVFVEESLDQVKSSAILGALLAILVLFIFLRRLGPTAIIGVTIPVSVVATFAPLYLAGVSLNIMSLGGLALGIGMLVDSSIVVLESISRRREEGAGVEAAAVEGTRGVGLAVLASTLTTVAVFLPIVFVEGVAGEFFRDQALAVVFSLLAALLAALFLIPMLASRHLNGAVQGAGGGVAARLLPWRLDTCVSMRRMRELRAAGGRRHLPALAFEALLRAPAEILLRAALLPVLGALRVLALVWRAAAAAVRPVLAGPLWLLDRGYRALEGGYRRLLAASLRARWVVVLLAAGCFYLAAGRLGDLGIELIPQVHQGAFTVESQLRVGTPVQETDRVARSMTRRAREALDRAGIPVAGMASSAGVARDVIARSGDGSHTARVHVRLMPGGDVVDLETRAVDVLREELERMPGLGTLAFPRPELFTTTSTALEVHVVGPDLERIQAAAGVLLERLAGVPGLVDLESTHRQGHPELVIRPDRVQMARYGLNPGDVAELVRAKVQGTVSTRVTRGDRKVDVLVRVPEELVDERGEILNLRVNPGGEHAVPLSAVATVEQRPGPAEIRRVAGERAVVLSAGVEDLDLRGAAERVSAAVEDVRSRDPAALRGTVVRIAGRSEESERSLDSMLFAMAVAVFLVYIVMASQFESLVHPFVILFSIPLAFVGVVFTLLWLEMELSVVVLIGAVLLAGIVVNNAIVLVDCVNQQRRAGMARDEALRRAGDLRFRPILMTTTTTVLGLLPLALGVGEGTEIRAPMAVTVIAGLTASTVLTLVVVPVVYALLSRPGRLPGREAGP